jgi:hypothetical protein
MNLKEKPGYIITEIILNIQGKFTAEELFLSLKDKMRNMFPNEKEMKNYIIKKIESVHSHGLIGKTDLFYFSV